MKKTIFSVSVDAKTLTQKLKRGKGKGKSDKVFHIKWGA